MKITKRINIQNNWKLNRQMPFSIISEQLRCETLDKSNLLTTV